MAEEMTARLGLPLLQAGQAQKELFHNEALTLIDLIAQAAVESASIATPPGAPAAGQAWVIATGATGAWAGRDGQLAGWTVGGWRFVVPVQGLRVQVADEGAARSFDGAAWQREAVRSDGYYQGGVRVVGAQQSAISDPTGGDTIDTQARAAINALLAAMRAHGLIGA